MQPSYDILGIGTPFFDITRFVSQEDVSHKRFPPLDSIHLDTEPGTLGGCCVNVVKVTSQLGLKSAIHGVIGDDKLSEKLLTLLRDQSVHPLLQPLKNTTSSVVACYVTPDAERTFEVALGDAARFSEEHLEKEHFSQTRHVHVEGFDLRASKVVETALHYAKQENKTTSMDLGARSVVETYQDRITKCIPSVDYLFGNREEVEQLTGEGDLFQALKESFLEHRTIVATDGAKGCYVRDSQGNVSHFPAQLAEIVLDTTGAGDFFCGGFLSGALTQKSIAECIYRGNLCASQVIQQQGAHLPDEKWSEIVSAISTFNDNANILI